MLIREKLRNSIGPCYLMSEGGEGGGGAGGEVITGNEGGGSALGEGGEGGNDFNFDEFKNQYAKDFIDKPYMQNIDSPEKLFATLDNTQSLIGKKIEIPGAEATEKEHRDYLELIRPKDTEVYKFDDSHLPENLKGIHSEGFDGKVKELFKEAALTPYQANILQQGYDKIMIDAHGDLLNQAAEGQRKQIQADADFDALADQAWGQDKENVQNVAKSLVSEFTPPEFKEHVQNLSNENLVVLASVLKGVSDKYISQDDLNTFKNNIITNTSLDGLRTEAQSEMAKLVAMGQFDPNYETQKAKVNEMYERIGKMSGDK